MQRFTRASGATAAVPNATPPAANSEFSCTMRSRLCTALPSLRALRRSSVACTVLQFQRHTSEGKKRKPVRGTGVPCSRAALCCIVLRCAALCCIVPDRAALPSVPCPLEDHKSIVRMHPSASLPTRADCRARELSPGEGTRDGPSLDYFSVLPQRNLSEASYSRELSAINRQPTWWHHI